MREIDPAFPALAPMEDAAETYRARRGTYGPSEQKYADVMMALFPDGLTLKTRRDWLRFGLYTQIVGKVARYANDFSNGHVDSMHDTGVYAFMLEAEDRTP